MTAWYGSCAKAAQKALQQVVKTAQIIVGTNLPSLDHLYKTSCLRRANKIIKGFTRPDYSLFQLLPSEGDSIHPGTHSKRVFIQHNNFDEL